MTSRHLLGLTAAVAALFCMAPKAETQGYGPYSNVYSPYGGVLFGGGRAIPQHGVSPYYDAGNGVMAFGPDGIETPNPSYNSAYFTPNHYNVTFGPDDIPRTSDAITVQRVGTRITMRWQGEPRAVETITFTLLDKNNRAIRTKTLTALPTQATLIRTSAVTAYSVNIQYINGTSNTITAPL